jgi:hypothetical protein
MENMNARTADRNPAIAESGIPKSVDHRSCPAGSFWYHTLGCFELAFSIGKEVEYGDFQVRELWV